MVGDKASTRNGDGKKGQLRWDSSWDSSVGTAALCTMHYALGQLVTPGQGLGRGQGPGLARVRGVGGARARGRGANTLANTDADGRRFADLSPTCDPSVAQYVRPPLRPTTCLPSGYLPGLSLDQFLVASSATSGSNLNERRKSKRNAFGMVHHKPPASQAEEQEHVEKLRLLCHELEPEIDARLKQAGEEGVTDAFLLRWCRARKYDLPHASKDIEHHSLWAVEIKPAGVIPKEKVQKDLDAKKTLSVGLAHNHFPHKHADSLTNFIVWALDATVTVGDAFCGEDWDGKFDIVFDLSGMLEIVLGRTAMVADKGLGVLTGCGCVRGGCGFHHRQHIANHYVEKARLMLGRMYICHAPFIFWGMWKVASPFLDPVTKDKIHFVTKDNEEKELGPFRELLPKELGGTTPLRDIEEYVAEAKRATAKKGTAALAADATA
eukprot:gene18783-25323_t